MANLQIRGLGQVGAVPDASPWDLPINGFDIAVNCRFDEGKVKRSIALNPLVLQPLQMWEDLFWLVRLHLDLIQSL